MTCIENAWDNSGTAWRHEATQIVGTTRHGHASDVHVVFDGHRLPRQLAATGTSDLRHSRPAYTSATYHRHHCVDAKLRPVLYVSYSDLILSYHCNSTSIQTGIMAKYLFSWCVWNVYMFHVCSGVTTIPTDREMQGGRGNGQETRPFANCHWEQKCSTRQQGTTVLFTVVAQH